MSGNFFFSGLDSLENLRSHSFLQPILLINPLRFLSSKFAFCVALSILLHAPDVKGDRLHFWAEEAGGNVTFYFQGSIDQTGFPAQGEVGRTAVTHFSSSLITPNQGFFQAGRPDGDSRVDFYKSVIPSDGQVVFGRRGQVSLPDSPTTGSRFGFIAGYLYLPFGYTRHQPISGSIRIDNATFSSLGVDRSPVAIHTTVGTNTIYFLTSPAQLAAELAAFKKSSENRLES